MCALFDSSSLAIRQHTGQMTQVSCENAAVNPLFLMTSSEVQVSWVFLRAFLGRLSRISLPSHRPKCFGDISRLHLVTLDVSRWVFSLPLGCDMAGLICILCFSGIR